MKKFLAINDHSFVDVITNSSTELFVCNTDKTLETVESMLRELLDGYNKFKGENHIFEETFEKPYRYTKEKFDRNRNSYWGHHDEDNIGKILIMSYDDNSIPYDMWGRINDVFEAYNTHLG